MPFDVNDFFASLPREIDAEELKALVPADMWEKDAASSAVVALRRSGKIDEVSYYDRYPDVKKSGMGAIEHYIYYGIKENRKLCNNYCLVNSSSDKYKFNNLECKSYFFSIIIICFNQEKYIQHAIDSALNQTFCDNEIIIVDDASTDSSRNIISNYEQNNKNIKVVYHNKNMSACKSRKDGVSLAEGRYVIFLDGDDTLLLDVTEKLYTICNEKTPDIINFNTNVITCGDSSEKEIEQLVKYLKPYDQYVLNDNVLMMCYIEKKWSWNLFSKCIKMEVVKKAFSYITDDYISRANDVYAYLPISYFAKSYIGVSSICGVNYNYGLGLDGNKQYNRAQFCSKISMSTTIKYIKEFADRINNDMLYNIYEKLYNEWMYDSAYRWINFTDNLDKKDAFDIILNSWGVWQTVASFAWNSWSISSLKLLFLKFINENIVISKRTKKIKTVAHFYPWLAPGGVERVIISLSKIYNDIGLNVIVITSSPPKKTDYILPDFVKHIVIPSGDTRDSYCEHAKALYEIINKYNIDVVHYHAHMFIYAAWDLCILKLSGIYTILHSHGLFMLMLKFYRKDVSRIHETYKLCDVLVTLSSVNNKYWETYGINSVFIPNPMTFDRKNITYSKLDTNIILYLSRISPEKNPLHALKAFLIVHEVVKDAKLIMVGDSPSPRNIEECKEFVKNNKLDNYVEFIGYQLDVAKWYQKATVFLFPSQSEGYGLVLQEALSYGLPCVMYDMPYLEFQRIGKGIAVVPQNDINALASMTIEILTNTSKRKQLGTEARDISSAFSNEKIKLMWKELFEKLEQINTLKKCTTAHESETDIVIKTLTTWYLNEKE